MVTPGPGGAPTGRGAVRGASAGGASNGEPVAFGDSRRVFRPENETLFSVPTQIGMRSSSVICGDRMMCGVSVRKTSVRFASVLTAEKSGPMSGRSPRNGIDCESSRCPCG